MPQFINTNIASLNTQRALNTSQNALQTSLERLSSGLRINSAKDDAAGLAIAERFTAQIRGLNQAVRNANDGISLAQTSEGALQEIGNNLQRIRELAVQSANATNSDSDRAALQAEVDQRIAEITRVGNQTQFNGLNLLDGSFTTQTFQVGANAGQTIDVTALRDSRASALGTNTLTVGGTAVGTAINTSATVNGITAETNLTVATTDASGATLTSSAISYDLSDGANVIAKAISTAGSGVDVSATATNSATLSGLSAVGTYSFDLATQDADGNAVTASITGVAITDQNDLSSMVSAINGVQSSTGITASFTVQGNTSSITLTTLDGRNIGIDTFDSVAGAGETISFAGQDGTAATLTEGLATDSGVATGTVVLSSSRGTIDIAGGNLDLFATATDASSFSSLNAASVTTAAGATATLSVVDAALQSVNSSRADLGAIQNRFESVIVNLQTTAENSAAARSRIQDADFAVETAELTRNQILQQAGIAMLSQANAAPQNVLALLQ